VTLHVRSNKMANMIEDSPQLHELLKLPLEKRLRVARRLIDSVIQQARSAAEVSPADETAPANPLLALAGRYEGGNGDTASRAEEILESEVDPTSGLSTR